MPPAGTLLFDFHGLAAAGDSSGACLGDNHLGAALRAAVPFTYLICHVLSPLYETLPTINYTPEVRLLSKLRLFLTSLPVSPSPFKERGKK
jgi:hypothetical protein